MTAALKTFMYLTVWCLIACGGDNSVTHMADEPDGVSLDTHASVACDERSQGACPDGQLCEGGVCVAESTCGPQPSDCCCNEGMDYGWTCSQGEWSCAYYAAGCGDRNGPCFDPWESPDFDWGDEDDADAGAEDAAD